MKNILKITVLLFALAVATAAYLPSQQIVEFDSIDDLPASVGQDINLECKRYVWIGTGALVTDKSLVFPAGCDSALVGNSILGAPLVFTYTGSDAFLKSTNFLTIRLENITFSTPLGTLFDFDGLGAFTDPPSLVKINDVIMSNVVNVGTIKDTTLRFNFSQIQDYGQGLIADSTRFTVERLAFFSPKDVTKNTATTFDNTTNTVESVGHNMYNNDVVRLTTDGTLPTGLRESITDLNGAVIDNGDGTVRFTTTSAHNLAIGDMIIPRGTTNYDNFYTVLAVPTTTTFDVEAAFVAETFANDVAQIGYYIINRTADDFQLSRTEGGSAVTFTDNGTGNHQFFENSIAITWRGAVYTVDMETVSFSNDNPNNTSFDFEPTISGDFSRGEVLGTGFDTPNRLNNFAGGSLDETYKYFRFIGTLNHPDSRNSGVVYTTGNATPTPLTQNVITEVTQGTFDIYNEERTFRSANRLCNDNPSPTIEKITALLTMVTANAAASEIRVHILLNGEDVTIAEPSIDVANRNVSTVDIEQILWGEGDCVSIAIENLDNGTDVTVVESKLIR